MARASQADPHAEHAQTLKLQRFALQSEARRLLKWKRLNECLRAPVGSLVQVDQSLEHGTCSYSGLSTCGSVWSCPICSAKVSERRRVELNQAIDNQRERGGSVLLLTLTFSHQKRDQLGRVLDAFSKALSRMTGCRSYKRWRSENKIVGQIRALEVTYGENGWHPHVHVLLFTSWSEEYVGENPELLVEMKRELFPIWRDWCFKVGLGAPTFASGIDLRDGSYAANYASKWGLASELTKANIKKGRSGSRSPWDLLKDSFLLDDQEAGQLFVEYAHRFRGKRQLFWSRGLRDALGLGVELTDEELAEQTDDHALALGQLEREEWKLILTSNARGEVLLVAERYGWLGVVGFLEDLRASRSKRIISDRESSRDAASSSAHSMSSGGALKVR